ncbi:MAG: ABC transporter ATP-binding protein [Anaerolineales bacterium]
MAITSEFKVVGAYAYDHRSTLRWMISHWWRDRFHLLYPILGWVIALGAFSMNSVLVGQAADYIVEPTGANPLFWLLLGVVGFSFLDALASVTAQFSLEILAKRSGTNIREELYRSLIGKSLVYHDRQRTGDLMARATEDVNGVMDMVKPGFVFVLDAIVGTVVPLLFIAALEARLLLVPLLFVGTYTVLVRRYVRHLNPVIAQQRAEFGQMNSTLEESIAGIALVKASTMEPFERLKFRATARQFRDYFVQQGAIEARYLPMLAYAVAFGLFFLHALYLYQAHLVDIATVVAAMGIFGILRFPVFISIFAWSILENGFASARRIQQVIQAETELDANSGGHRATLQGDIVFENVSFGYEDGAILQDISFRAAPGETVAIVGQTGAGKSSLTALVNRTYDVTAGRVLVDGVDIRTWNLDALRSQIAKIEQDIFLFSRTVAENIAFGAPGATQAQIEQAAQDAQAHDFIMEFADGYATQVGERGTSLSGGQRQRIALARAFLSDPRILILDDSTSAIDSATEDQIQQALRRAQQGRTTLLITHRLSQIRWADRILVLDGGRLVANGTHDALLQSSPPYRRIFARYEASE